MAEINDDVINAVRTAFELWIDEYEGCSWFEAEKVRKKQNEAIDLLENYEIEIQEARDQGFNAGYEEGVKEKINPSDFFDWLACSVILDDSNWENAHGFYREVICRKLVRLGVLTLKDDEYILPEPRRAE